MLIEHVQEILATLTLAFENLLESSGQLSGTVSSPTRPSSPLDGATGQRIHRQVRVKKFQRPSRRLQSKTPSPTASPVSFEVSRKRSWDAEQQQQQSSAPTLKLEPDEVESEHPGKRSKSVVLLQEMESLRVSSPPSPVDAELAVLAEQEFAVLPIENSILSLQSASSFDEILSELEALNSVDLVVEALMTVQPALLSQNRDQFTFWCKCRLISRTFESFEGLSIKACLTRFICLMRAVNHVAEVVDWRDPELSFLLFRGLTQLLGKQAPIDSKSTHLMRKLDETVGVIRALLMACAVLCNRPPRSVLQFLASNAEAQLCEFFEQLLEGALNLFELCSVLNSNFAMVRTFVLICIHFARLYVSPAGTAALYGRLCKCKIGNE